jgi:hypothetical protein
MGHLAALYRVCFDLSVFKNAVAQRPRRTFAFLVILTLLSSLAGTFAVMRLMRGLARRLDPYIDQLPTVTIKNGKASADVPQPWVKRIDSDDEGHAVVLIIDTTGQRTDFAPDEIGLFLQRDQLLFKFDDQRREIPLSSLPDTVVGPKTVRGQIARILKRAPPWIAAALCLYFLAAKAFQALLLVLAGLMGTPGGRRPLGFGALFTVGVYALAPPVLLDCVVRIFGVKAPFFWLVYVAIAIAYAILGARAASSDEPGTTAL